MPVRRRGLIPVWPLFAALLLFLDYGLCRLLVFDQLALVVRGQSTTGVVAEKAPRFTREPKALHGHTTYVVTYGFEVGEPYMREQVVSRRDYDGFSQGTGVEVTYDPASPRNSVLTGSVRPFRVAMDALVLLAVNGAVVYSWRRRSFSARRAASRHVL